jgi:hypothetical protein
MLITVLLRKVNIVGRPGPVPRGYGSAAAGYVWFCGVLETRKTRLQGAGKVDKNGKTNGINDRE